MQPKFDQAKYITEYQKEHYSQIVIRIPKALATEFRAAAKAAGIPMTDILTAAIKGFVNSPKK